jgi:hypothetical protein
MATFDTPGSGVAPVQVLMNVPAAIAVHVNTSAAVAVTRAVGVAPLVASAKVRITELTAVLVGSLYVYAMVDSVAPVTP